MDSKIIETLVFGKLFEKYKMLGAFYLILLCSWITANWLKTAKGYSIKVENFNSFLDEIIMKFTEPKLVGAFFFFVFIFLLFSFCSQILIPLLIYPIAIFLGRTLLFIKRFCRRIICFIGRKKYETDPNSLFIFSVLALNVIKKGEDGKYLQSKNYNRFISILNRINHKDFVDGLYRGSNYILATLCVFLSYGLNKTFNIAYITLFCIYLYYILECCCFIYISKNAEEKLNISIEKLNKTE